MKTVLITGATGFCGWHLIQRLRKEGDVRIVGFSLDTNHIVASLCDEYIQADICDFNAVQTIVQRSKPDIVFHLAGIPQGDTISIYHINFTGSMYLLESLRLLQPDARILLVGSAAEYGPVEPSDSPITEDHPCNPVGPYGVSKYAMTLSGLDFARCYGMEVAIARPFNIIGPGISPALLVGAILSRAKQAIEAGGDLVVKVGNVHTQRDFIAVEDAVEAYLQIINGEHWGEVFNVCSGRAYAISSIITQLLANAAQPLRWEVDPALVRETDTKVSYGSFKKIEKTYGFKPVMTLEDSLRAAWHFAIDGKR